MFAFIFGFAVGVYFAPHVAAAAAKLWDKIKGE